MSYSTQSSRSIDHSNEWLNRSDLENAANELGCVFSYEYNRDKIFYEYEGEIIAEIDNPENKFNAVWRITYYKNGFDYHDSGFLENSFDTFKSKIVIAMQGVKRRQRDILKKEIEEESANPLL